LSGCGAEETFETVADVIQEVPVMAARQFYVSLPEEAATPTFQDEAQQLYVCEDYTISKQIFSGGDLEKTVNSVTGMKTSDLQILKTVHDTYDRYDFVWTAAAEEGLQVGRASIYDDGNYHYVLTALAAEETAGNLRLEIQDMELDAATHSIQEDKTDLAFTCGRVKDSHFAQIPVFSEPMVLITSVASEYPEPVALSQLSLSDEVYIEWSNAFAPWHQQMFIGEKPQIRISIMAHLQKFIEQKQRWAIVPVSVAEGLEQQGIARRLQTVFPLPCREVSCITAADCQNEPAIEAFLECLRDVIGEHPQITAL
jgi:DNA-binding transcriptional LysR family regulator